MQQGVITSEHRYSFLSEGPFQRSELTMTDTVRFDYYCYRCGENNALDLPAPTAPDYHHTDLKCKSCGDGTRVILSSCSNPGCSHFVYWINDISIPELVQSFAKYMTTNMQAMIDRAAQQGARISIDTPDKFQIPAACPCDSQFNIEITIPDLD